MKKFIKNILPESVVRAAWNFRDQRRLRAATTMRLNHTNLRCSDDVVASGLTRNQSLEEVWRRDDGEISALYADLPDSGGVNPGDRRALYYLVAMLAPKAILEIGTHIGASTAYLARASKLAASGGRVTTVDVVDVNEPLGPWKSHGLSTCPRDLLTRLHCDNVRFAVAGAEAFMSASSDRYDLIFLDGDHSAGAVYRELSLALDILNPDGVVLLHDYYPDAKALFPDGVVHAGPYRALKRAIRENPGIEARSLGPLPWVTKQRSHASSLAIVTRMTGAQ